MRIHKKIAVSNTITFVIFLMILFFLLKEYIDISNIKNTSILKIIISIFIFFTLKFYKQIYAFKHLQNFRKI